MPMKYLNAPLSRPSIAQPVRTRGSTKKIHGLAYLPRHYKKLFLQDGKRSNPQNNFLSCESILEKSVFRIPVEISERKKEFKKLELSSAKLSRVKFGLVSFNLICTAVFVTQWLREWERGNFRKKCCSPRCICDIVLRY